MYSLPLPQPRSRFITHGPWSKSIIKWKKLKGLSWICISSTLPPWLIIFCLLTILLIISLANFSYSSKILDISLSSIAYELQASVTTGSKESWSNPKSLKCLMSFIKSKLFFVKVPLI